MKQNELEKRAAARHALLGKVNLEMRAKARRAYFQGGPGVNDPKELGYPGEIKYPRMEVPVGGDSREWEQAWFEGAAEQTTQKMGPQGVELELKKKLQRAGDNLVNLQKKADEDPEFVRKAAMEAAAELNGIIDELDAAGFAEEAQEADATLQQLFSYLKQPVKTAKKDIRKDLLKLANALDEKGYSDEAAEVDEILAELK